MEITFLLHEFDFYFLRFYISIISHNIFFFSFKLVSLNIMSAKSIHTVSNGMIVFFLMVEYYSIVHIYHIFLPIHVSMDT